MGNIGSILTPKIELSKLYELRALCNKEETKYINSIHGHSTFKLCPYSGKPDKNISYFKQQDCTLGCFLDSGVDLNGKHIVINISDLTSLNIIYKKYYP